MNGLEEKIRNLSGCTDLERGENFNITVVHTAHGETGRGKSYALQFNFYIKSWYGHAKIINGRMSEFSVRKIATDEQKKYAKLWLWAYYLWAYPPYRNP